MCSNEITKMSDKLSALHIPEKPPGLLDKYSWVYMLSSSSRRALYTGVTNNLAERVFQHKNDVGDGFTKKYKCHRLVYYELFAYIGEAIAREKEVKAWRREKKNALIETMNPQWRDLSEGWYDVKSLPQEGQHEAGRNRKVSPHPRQAGDASK